MVRDSTSHNGSIHNFSGKNSQKYELHILSEIGQINTFGSDTFIKSSLKHKENEEKLKMDYVYLLTT